MLTLVAHRMMWGTSCSTRLRRGHASGATCAVTCCEGIVVHWWLIYGGRVRPRIHLLTILATLRTRLGEVTGGCSGVDLARAGPSVQLAARERLVLRGAFQGAAHALHLVVVSMAVSL